MRYLIDLHHGIGDCVDFIPALDRIIEKDPEAIIDVIVQKSFYGDVFTDFPNINRIIALPDVIKNLTQYIGFNKYDVGVVAAIIYDKTKAIVLLKALGCRKIYVDKELPVWNKHACLRNQDTLKPMGIETQETYPKLHISKIEKKDLFEKINVEPTKYVISFCLGGNIILKPSKENMSMKGVNFKQWPFEYYVQLINMFSDEYTVLLVGGEKEKQEFESYIGNIKREYVDLLGKLSLVESAQVLGASDVVVGNDTGMMHVAGAMGCNTLSIHGPTNPEMCGVYSEKAQFMTPTIECMYCYAIKGDSYFMCNSNLGCLRSIQPESVKKQIETMIDKG